MAACPHARPHRRATSAALAWGTDQHCPLWKGLRECAVCVVTASQITSRTRCVSHLYLICVSCVKPHCTNTRACHSCKTFDLAALESDHSIAAISGASAAGGTAAGTNRGTDPSATRFAPNVPGTVSAQRQLLHVIFTGPECAHTMLSVVTLGVCCALGRASLRRTLERRTIQISKDFGSFVAAV